MNAVLFSRLQANLDIQLLILVLNEMMNGMCSFSLKNPSVFETAFTFPTICALYLVYTVQALSIV